MTFDECHRSLVSIRRKQGTRCPIIRVDYGGSVYKGRVSRADSDPEHRGVAEPKSGILVLQAPGSGRGSETVLQIANIAEGGIRDLAEE